MFLSTANVHYIDPIIVQLAFCLKVVGSPQWRVISIVYRGGSEAWLSGGGGRIGIFMSDTIKYNEDLTVKII